MFPKIYQPLSGRQLHDLLPNATILKYSQLKNFDKLPPLPLILLYEFKPDFGHWTSVLETKEGLEHYDSFGFLPDKELEVIVPKEYRKVSGQNYKYLLHLLYNSNKPVNYNQYPFQMEDTSTCGRWVVLRNNFNFLTIDQFKKMIDKTSKQLNISPDELVSRAI